MSETRLFKVWKKNKQSDYASIINGHDYCWCDSEGDYIRFEDYVDLLNIIKELRKEQTQQSELREIEERRRIVPCWLKEELSELREIKESVMKLVIKLDGKTMTQLNQ